MVLVCVFVMLLKFRASKTLLLKSAGPQNEDHRDAFMGHKLAILGGVAAGHTLEPMCLFQATCPEQNEFFSLPCSHQPLFLIQAGFLDTELELASVPWVCFNHLDEASETDRS